MMVPCRQSPTRAAAACVAMALWAVVTTTAASPAAVLPAFSAMAEGSVGDGWRFGGLPGKKVAATGFEIVTLDGRRVLRIASDAGYGVLTRDLPGVVLTSGAVLRWSWRLERGLPHSDLRTREGDDVPLKVCAMFDLPLAALSFSESAKLRMARAITGEALPAATLCYVWDRLLPEGSLIDNVYSRRVRLLVASSGAARPGQWLNLERNLAADFLRAFGDESTGVPPLRAIVVGADADNTRGRSLGYVGDVMLQP